MRKSLDVEQAIRCFRMSHDGRHVAAGDWYGNIRIHDTEEGNLEEIKVIEAHENEVLSLDYTRQIDSKTTILESNPNIEEAYLLASGSRDSLIQIYDSKIDYEPVQIIEEH
jgi:WD40 repeat protein